MPSKESKFRAELRAQIELAEKQHHGHIDINSGELHRKLGGYPGPNHSMPTCCRGMWQEHAEGHAYTVSRPPSGADASLTIRYLLSRSKRWKGHGGALLKMSSSRDDAR